MQKEHYQWVDTCKTFGLLLVILGHGRLLDDAYQQWIYSFHMPLFFILSGMLYNYKVPLQMLKHDIKRLLLPYLIINLICLVIQCGIRLWFGQLTLVSVIQQIIGILVVSCHTGEYPSVSTPTWFIIALFIARMLLSLKNSRVYLYLIAIVSVLIYILLQYWRVDTWIPFDSAFMAIPFLVTGILSKRMLSLKCSLSYTILPATIGFGCCFFLTKFNGLVDMAWASYGRNLLIFYFTGFIGSLSVILIIKSTPPIAVKICSVLSKGSLLVIGFNLILVMIIQNFIERITPNHTIPMGVGIIAGIAILGFFYILTRWCQRYFPLILGTK